jgi:ABC-type antimicrobial peptide transport system permease subunit
VRTVGDPGAMWRDVQRVAYDIDPRQPISRPQTLEQVRSTSIASPRLTATLATLFAILALIVTAAGIGGVVSFFVSQRSVEIGVRRALGAPRWTLMRMVIQQGLAPVAIGLAAGVAIALVSTRAVARLLFEIHPADPATYVAVVAMLAVVAAMACLAPARRAAAIEPATMLRTE